MKAMSCLTGVCVMRMPTLTAMKYQLSKKNKDDTQRIDLVAAGINAMARLPAFYEEYGGTGGSSGVRFCEVM